VRRYRQGRGRARSWLAAVLVVLACLGAASSTVAFWGHEMLLNTDRYVATVAPIIKDPSVTRSIGDFTSAKVLEAVRLQGLITQQMRSQLSRRIERLLRTNVASAAWVSVNRVTHEQLIAVLRAGSGHITGRGDTVTLDLVPFISLGVNVLEGVLPSSIASRLSLSRIDASASPDQQRSQLATALRRPLAPGFGRVTLLRSGRLERDRRALRLFDLLVWALIGLTVALAGLAVAVSPRRRRTLIYLGVGVVALSLILRLVIGRLDGPIVRSFDAGDLAPVLKTGVDTMLGSLAAFTLWPLVVGAIIAAIACLAGLPAWLSKVSGGRRAAAGGRF
jgi:hypothetical protein